MVQIAESPTPKAKRSAPVLSHLEIHPKMGGGHIVRHVYTNYSHEPKEVHFGEDGKREGKGGGEHITAHLAKHAGLPGYEAGVEDEEETEA